MRDMRPSERLKISDENDNTINRTLIAKELCDILDEMDTAIKKLQDSKMDADAHTCGCTACANY